MNTHDGDRVIWRPELQKMMGVTSETIRRWMKAKHKFPQS